MKIHEMSGDEKKREYRSDDRLPRSNRGSPRKKFREDMDLRNKLRKTGAQAANIEEVRVRHPSGLKPSEMEDNPEVLERRQKQINYGKNTVDYTKYSQAVDKQSRTDTMPRTPNKYLKCPRRRWDGMIKSWKQAIHRLVNNLEGSDDKLEVDEEIGSWSSHVEEEEMMTVEEIRKRIDSTASSDQGLGGEISSGAVSPIP